MHFNLKQEFKINQDDLKDPIVLIGWPGIALVAKLAIMTIKDSINADLFLTIEYFDFAPKAVVGKNGSLEIPSAKVYYQSSDKTNQKNDMFILTAEYQPQSPRGVFEFSKNFCEEMDRICGGNIKMYVSMGALITDNIMDTPIIHVCGTNDIIKSFLEFENTTLMKGGLIAGANGILPAWAGTNDFAPGICLLAETIPLPMMTLDPRASKALITLLRDYFKIKIDISDIDKKIEEMESMFISFKKQADSFMRDAQEDLGSDSYFR
ncbi:MAG: PAC2 family protein [Promethearchaeota archaeon]